MARDGRRRRARTCETAVIALDDVMRRPARDQAEARLVDEGDAVPQPIWSDAWDEEPTVREPPEDMEALIEAHRRTS